MLAHIDADAFFASVLQRKDPRLKGKPLLALGMGGGCVIAASYEAKAKGIKTGMRLTDALALCPQALRLPSDFRETGLASQQIEAILQDISPLIEQYSIDEWFIDLDAIPGGQPLNLCAWAEGLQRHIGDSTALSVSIGIGPSKLLAKMASEYRKPKGITIVSDEQAIHGTYVLGIPAFLGDRPAASIPGIGRQRLPQVEALGWLTAWDVATGKAEDLQKLCGRPGLDMQRELLGEYVSQIVIHPASQKSISRCRSFPRTCAPRILWATLLRHLEYVVLKMRTQELTSNGMSIWLRDDSYHHESTHISFPQTLDTEESIQPYLQKTFEQLCQHQKFYTQAGLSLWRLTPRSPTQFSLFTEPLHIIEDEQVQASLDTLHRRFGRKSITRASAMEVETGTRQGFEIPFVE